MTKTNNTENFLDNDDQLSEGAPSFCDLRNDVDEFMESYHEHEEAVLPRTTYPEIKDFEFFNTIAMETEPPTEAVVFCGEIIRLKQKNEFVRHPKNGLFIRRESFKRSQSFRSDVDVSAGIPAVDSKTRSKSVRFGRLMDSPATGNSSFQSSSSPKHKVFIGLVKLQPKMELSDIRKRQLSRKTIPAPMFPVKEFNEPAKTGGDKVVRSKSRSTQWGLFRPLWYSAHLVSALTKASIGCIPHGHVCK